MSSDRLQSTYDPRYDGIYQRGGGAETSPASPVSPASHRVVPPAPQAPALPVPEAAADPSAIREVVPETPTRQDHRAPRNPYDRWVWILAGVLMASGMFFLLAPILYERQYLEAMNTAQTGGGYVNPWYNYTSLAAPVLLLLGVATAVAQLFVLSIRHTLGHR